MPSPKAASATSISQLIERFDDFKGDFSFDAMFGNMVNELLPAFLEEDADVAEGGAGGTDAHIRAASDAAKLPSGAVTGTPLFPAVDDLLGLFKDSCKELVNLRQKIDVRLQNMK